MPARGVAPCLPQPAGERGCHGVRATARVADDDGRVLVVIEDDGPGIPKADLERMFEIFFQLDSEDWLRFVAQIVDRKHEPSVAVVRRCPGHLPTHRAIRWCF